MQNLSEDPCDLVDTRRSSLKALVTLSDVLLEKLSHFEKSKEEIKDNPV